MFFRDSSVSTSNNGLGIGNYPVDPWEKLTCRPWISKDDFVMRYIAVFRSSSIGTPSIRPYCLQKILPFLGSGTASKSLQKRLNSTRRSIVHHLHMRKTRMFVPVPISIKRNCTKNSALPFAPSPSFCSLGSKERIIHLHQPRKAISGISICHGFANLVSHQPSGSIFLDIKQPFYLRYRYPNFAHRHMIDHPIPFYQGRPGSMKNRSGCYTDLVSTELTVKKMSLRQIPSFVMSALGTKKSIWPPLLRKVCCTSFIIWKFFLKFDQTALFISLGHFFTCPRIYLKSN